MRVTILVPVYNEEKTILLLLERIRAQYVEGVEFEVVVVNDGSTDSSRAILDANPHLYSKVLHKINGGKGSAVREGLAVATGEYVLFQDADLEYDPADYSVLLMPAKKFKVDVVLGSRFLAPKCVRVVYFWHKVGNMVITLFFNLLNNLTFTDIYTCYLLFRRELILPQELKTDGWEQQAEILGLAVRRGKSFYEVPINYFGRTYDEGKKIRWYHIFSVLRTIFGVRLLRM